VSEEGERAYVSRGGLKLAHALEAFGFDPSGLRCADLGASTGGFTDCLLRRGAAHVVCVDTGYGVLDYRLRTDPRVTVMERANALHAEPPELVDLVVMDLGWTAQRLAVPAALRWLRDRASGRIITLIKPHYEADAAQRGSAKRGVLSEEEAEAIAARVAASMPSLGCETLGVVRSQIAGGARKGSGKGKGNAEWLALLRAADDV
jgi:23S rRNA (cytidine1920-2'-O)/16S rRNA (cytidine1409-2'-O)-methyltransferase